MDTIHTQSSNEDLLCCRACLGTDCKLFNIQAYKLSEAFSRISGTPVSMDHFPQYLCTHCRTLLLKCMSFKDMCLWTEQLLERELLKGELNTDCIRRIDHSHWLLNLTLSVVNTIDSTQHPHTEDIKKEPIDINNTDEPTIETAIDSEVNMEIDEDNLSETTIDEVNINETTNDEVNLSETTIDEVNLSETTNDEVNLSETTIDEVNLSETTIDEVNLSEITIDEVNLSETTIDEVNLSETTIDKVHLAPNTNLINLGASNTDKAHIETVAIDSRKQKADSKVELVKKKDKAKIKGNIDNVVGDVFVVNKMKTVKTYKRNIATVKKKMDIEIQAYSDKVNAKLDKNESNIDLDTDMSKANINVSYKSINTAYASIINDDIGDSDIDDINEVKAHMYVVDVDNILKKAVKKTKKCKRKIGITVKKNIENSKDSSDKADEKPVKQVKKRRRKERKIKYRNPENDYLPEFDFAKVESDYGVKIVTLSKQEQLEEIAARKQSANYTTARFPCEDCGKGFDMEPAYNNHRRRHSPSAGSHACEICLVRFKLPCLRHRHQDMHRLKFVCVECGFVTRTRCTAKLHHEMHNGRWFVCKHCGKGFSKPTSYLTHVRLSHPALNVACGACGETFVSEQGLKMHASLMHSEIMKPQQFKCPTCSASFVSSDALNRHTDSGEHAGSACEQCGESCASEEALQAHVGERHPSESHRCDECRATFSSGAAFDTHFRRKHLNERYTPACRAPRKRPAPPGPRRVPSRGQFVCEQCGHIAPNAALLRYHQNGHLAVKPFPCAQCPKTFATNAARKSHARSHKGEKPHKCPVCSLSFTQKANLKRHHSVVHLGVHANASCHVCARVFTTKSSLQLHISSVHNGQPWPARERRRKVAKN